MSERSGTARKGSGPRRASSSATVKAPPAARPDAGSTAGRKRPASAEDTALKLWVVLARAQLAVARHAEADVARHGLTLAEFAILEVLYHRGPLLLGEVQRKILVSSGGVTYLVDRLAGKGLVERRECTHDRRARYAALTAAGERLVARIFPEHAKEIARAVSGLSKDEQQRAITLLRKLGISAAELPVSGGTP
ncbi:MAG TPA: MarR family transcriptional regulator [Gemmatimonadaceae bacterium]|nr:MarR family transcriptional regulator [Gemmatimonadaceae bacterium]